MLGVSPQLLPAYKTSVDRDGITCLLPALKGRAQTQQMPHRLQNTPLGWLAKPSVPRMLLLAESWLGTGRIFTQGAASRFCGARAWRESAAEVAEETGRRQGGCPAGSALSTTRAGQK